MARGSHSDWVMHAPGGEDPVAGICHFRGVTAGLPPLWLICITVGGLDGALDRCRSLGGEVLGSPGKLESWGRLAVIRDPAGAVAALIEPPSGEVTS